MASRMDKYSDETFEERTTRNKDLYNTIYGQRSRFEDLPIPDNTNEIDIESFKNITLSRNEYQKKAENKNIEPISKEEEESILERTGSYDINEMLKKAKDSNTFISEKKNNNSNRKYLKVLDIDKNLTKEDVDKEEYLSHNTTLSLDILSDLKPTNNTLVTDPIKDDSLEETKSLLKEMTAKMETIKTITPATIPIIRPLFFLGSSFGNSGVAPSITSLEFELSTTSIFSSAIGNITSVFSKLSPLTVSIVL